jgi:hypothetical protein
MTVIQRLELSLRKGMIDVLKSSPAETRAIELMVTPRIPGNPLNFTKRSAAKCKAIINQPMSHARADGE